MYPAESIRRTPLIVARYTLFAGSNAMPYGRPTAALIASPSFPVASTTPVPATVRMIPAASIVRTRLLLESVIQTRPLLSTATERGLLILAVVGRPPSPAKPVPFPPATRKTCDGGQD